MAQINKLLLFSLLLFLFGLSIQAQEKVMLLNVLKSLEAKHDIQFNYAEDVIENVYVHTPSMDFSLSELLNNLEEQTGLRFKNIGNGFVVVSQPNDIMLCGYLVDANTKTPLELATIQSPKNATTSKGNGFFSLEIERVSDSITIRHIGYKAITKSYADLKDNACKTLVLYPEAQALSEILLSNYIVSGISKLKDASFEIDASKLNILPGLVDTDVLQAVQAFPGITSVDETVSNINIRGGSNDQNLVLWDGIKMYQTGHFFGLISMYHPQITQKVSLNKNGSDVSYTDGVSGTIAMKTSEKLNSSFKGSLGVNFTDVNGFADIPVGEKSSLQLAARKSINDFIETPTYNTFFERIAQDTEVSSNPQEVVNSNQDFDFYDMSLRWLYNIGSKDKLRVNFINVVNELMFDESSTANNTATTRESSLKQNSIAGAIAYERQWNSNWRTVFEAHETDYKLEAINANVLDSQRFLQENKVSETSLKFSTFYQINPQFKWLNGYHFVETEVTNLDDVDVPVFRALVSEVVRTHGLYSQLAWSSKNRKTTLKGGLRGNYIEKFSKIIIEPRLSLSHNITDHFNFEVLGEFKHQNVSQIINFQNDFLGIEKRRWQLSNNEDIPIIRSKQISSGLHYSKDNWLLSIEGFYKNVKGVTTQSQGFQNQFQFIRSSGDYDAYGFDVLLRKRFHKINAWLSYSYLESEYDFNSLSEDKFPSNFDIRHTFTLGSVYNSDRLKLSTGLNWHSGNPSTEVNLEQSIINDKINFTAPNASRLRDYLRVDVSAIYKLNFGRNTKTHLGISVWNLLDRENEINNFYRVIDGEVLETVQKSLGFTPNLLFRVYFD